MAAVIEADREKVDGQRKWGVHWHGENQSSKQRNLPEVGTHGTTLSWTWAASARRSVLVAEASNQV